MFAAHPYQELATTAELEGIDLAAHLTNTYQHDASQDSEPYVKLLDELVGLNVLGKPGELTSDAMDLFTEADVIDIISQMKSILGETFKSALANPVHFMVSAIPWYMQKKTYNKSAFTECIRAVRCRLHSDFRRFRSPEIQSLFT